MKNEEVVQRVNVLKYATNFYLELQAMGLHRLLHQLNVSRRDAERPRAQRMLGILRIQ